MPRIKEYEATNVKLNPSNLGETATDQAARRLSTYTTQAAAGAREIGQLQEQSLVEEGKQIEAFLRYTGLSQQGVGVSTKGAGSVDRTLIGTGSNSGIVHNIPDPTDFEGQGELMRGARGISRLANNMVTQASPLADLPNPKRTKETYDAGTKKVADTMNPDAGVQAEESPRIGDGNENWSPYKWSPSVPQDTPAPDPATPDIDTGGMDLPYPYPSLPPTPAPAAPDATAPAAAAPTPDASQPASAPGLTSDVMSDIGNWITSPPF